MLVQITSDLHIDINTKHIGKMLKKPDAGSEQILCLAGDICSTGDEKTYELFSDFIKYECANYKLVLHVAGNHEYYSDGITDMKAIHQRFRSLESKFSNYRFLDNEIVEVKNGDRKLVFVGSTLWSYVPDFAKEIIRYEMNDYRFINVSKPVQINGEDKLLLRKLIVEDTQEFHNIAKKFIYEAVEKYKSDPSADVVLITHHKPLWNEEEFANSFNLTQYAFESPLEYLMVEPVRLAIHGHTHKKMDTIVNSTRIISNPLGYWGECPQYDNNCVISL